VPETKPAPGGEPAFGGVRIGLVVNELSGDILGASLMAAIREQVPEAVFEGITGPGMEAQGCLSLSSLEQLSVMGLVEILRHLPEILRLRRKVLRHFLAYPPDVFIGIDAPDFNLGLEKRLRQAGIPTVHYVCPSVWAWRPGRIKVIRRAVDLVLSLLPFEEAFLAQHGIPARFIGHPLADEIPLEVDTQAARARLGIPAEARVLAVLPGSRRGEVSRLARVFIEAALRLRNKVPDLFVVVPIARPSLQAGIRRVLDEMGANLPLLFLDGQSREAMAAADWVLAASGTATLEAMLLHRPMVVAYRLHPLTYWLLRLFRLVKVPFIALPNLLAEAPLVPEFVQHRCRPEFLAEALGIYVERPEVVAALRERFTRMHRAMRREASRQAAQAVLALLRSA